MALVKNSSGSRSSVQDILLLTQSLWVRRTPVFEKHHKLASNTPKEEIGREEALNGSTDCWIFAGSRGRLFLEKAVSATWVLRSQFLFVVN